MPRSTQAPFDPDAPLYGADFFRVGSDVIAPGDVFAWRVAGLTEAETLFLYETGRVRHGQMNYAQERRRPAAVPDVLDILPTRTPAEPEPAAGDDLDLVDTLAALREIADEVGAPHKVTKAAQRQAIREARDG